MKEKLKTAEEIDRWAADNGDKEVEITYSLMQEIADTVVPEMCGYALVKLGAQQGH